MVQSNLGKKLDPISKISRAKRAGGCAQVVNCLHRKYKTLVLKKEQYHQSNNKKLCLSLGDQKWYLII
jgi:hypothetical protein